MENDKTSFDRLLEERNAEGWHYIDREGLTRTQFQQDARFVEVPYQTEEDIKNRYLQMAKQKIPQGEYEVDLVPDLNSDKLRRLKETVSEEEFQEITKNLRKEDRVYFVFLRKKAT
jgi:DNA-binding MurR/RpiR family transcriptional regulator